LLENTVLEWVARYGYAAIFSLLVLGIVGLPVPDEFLLTGCGFLIYQGHLRLVPAFASALGGSACGITCSYIIGRTIGWKFLHSPAGRLLHISDEHIRRVHDWFDRIGHWALLVGYFIPGVRHFTAIVAGTSKLEPRSFALFAYSGATLWVSTFIFLGYHFGPQWTTILKAVDRNLKLLSIVGGVIAIVYVLFRLLKSKRAANPRS
jgi:membrane protein DedA with SNARE-associated domain